MQPSVVCYVQSLYLHFFRLPFSVLIQSGTKLLFKLLNRCNFFNEPIETRWLVVSVKVFSIALFIQPVFCLFISIDKLHWLGLTSCLGHKIIRIFAFRYCSAPDSPNHSRTQISTHTYAHKHTRHIWLCFTSTRTVMFLPGWTIAAVHVTRWHYILRWPWLTTVKLMIGVTSLLVA